MIINLNIKSLIKCIQNNKEKQLENEFVFYFSQEDHDKKSLIEKENEYKNIKIFNNNIISIGLTAIISSLFGFWLYKTLIK